MAKTVAGASSKVNPKRPNRASEDVGYNLVEDVNQGPHGARKGKIGPAHGQGSDSIAGRDELVPVDGNLRDPYKAKGSDFPDGKTTVDAEHGQGGGATWENPNGGGKNELITDSLNQCGPRHAEDDGVGEHGAGTPVPGDKAARVAANFKIDRNDGESRSDGAETGIPEYIDLQTGHIQGGSQTRVMDVPDHNVHIPSRK